MPILPPDIGAAFSEANDVGVLEESSAALGFADRERILVRGPTSIQGFGMLMIMGKK